MQKTAKVLKVLACIVGGVYVLVQLMTVLAITMGSTGYSVVPLLLVTIGMLAAVVLFAALKNHPLIGLILAAACGVVILIIALDLRQAFPVLVSADGDIDYGLDWGKIIVRHMGMAVTPVLMLGSWLCGRSAKRTAQFRRVKPKSTLFDADDEPIFKDRG